MALLHPLGHADTVRVIGRSCSKELSLCPQQVSPSTGLADLVVLAPSAQELSSPGWLGDAVRDAAGSLRSDGVLYVLAHRSKRREMKALLRSYDLKVTSTVIHHPTWSDAGTLVPLKLQALTYAFSQLIRTNPLRRRLVFGLMRVPGSLALLAELLPYVGLVVQRQGAQPQSSWFTGLLGSGSGVSNIVVNTSWRGREGAVLLHAVDAKRGDATAIAKTWLSAGGEDAVAREAAGLQEIAARAAEFGARVPRLLGQGILGDQPYVAETAVTGEKVASVLLNHPGRLEELLQRLASWLASWNSATAEPRVLTQNLLDELLLGPALQLLPDLDAGEAYERELASLAKRLLGQTIPFVATHGDLTMVNVLIDRAGRLGIIDWETATRSGLPLADFFYAAVDAAAAVEDYRDRPVAFASCFAATGRHRAIVSRFEARFARELGLNRDQVTLSFHASWLRFALDERRESAKTTPDEFLQIARLAARGIYERAGHGSVE